MKNKFEKLNKDCFIRDKYMIDSILLNDFLEIEKKYNLYEKNYEGVDYWNYTRFVVWHNIIVTQKLSLGRAQNQSEERFYEKLKNYAIMIIRSFMTRKMGEAEICFINHPRKVYTDGYYQCLYTEEIKERTANSVTLEFPYHSKHLKPVKDDKIIYLDRLYTCRGIGTRLFKFFRKRKYNQIQDAIFRQIKIPLGEIENKFHLDIDTKKIVKLMADHVLYYKATKKRVDSVLEKLKPKLVVEVVGYDFDCMVFNECCKNKGIETIELQHGIMTEHAAYNYNTIRVIPQLPDYLFLFSDFWRQYVNLPIKNENLITVGYPYFEKKIKQAHEIKEYSDDKLNVLFLSQGAIGRKLYRLAVELAEILEKDKYRIFYKLHPGEYTIWRDKYSGLEESDVIVLADNSIQLYDYFATSHIQVGVYSTALYEGLGFGLITYIYRIEQSWQMSKLEEAGFVSYVDNAQMLANNVRYQFGKKQHKNIKEKFWRENAIVNMENSIRKIISKQERTDDSRII